MSTYFSTLSPVEATAFLQDEYLPGLASRRQTLTEALAAVDGPVVDTTDDALRSIWSWFIEVYVDAGRRPIAEAGLTMHEPFWIEAYFPDFGDVEVRGLMCGLATLLHQRLQQTHGSDIYSVNEQINVPQPGRQAAEGFTTFVEQDLVGAGMRAWWDHDPRRCSRDEGELLRLLSYFEDFVIHFADTGLGDLESPRVHVDSELVPRNQIEIGFDERTPFDRRDRFVALFRSLDGVERIVHYEDDPSYLIAEISVGRGVIAEIVGALWDRSEA